MISKTSINFVVFTYNEEERLEYILRNIHGHGNIIIVDNCSTDSTVSIAKNYTNQIHIKKNIGYVENEETMDFVANLVATGWVYLTYVDELIPRVLMEQIKSIASSDKFDIVNIYRKNFMYGQEVFNYGKHHLRMFRVGAVDFRKNIVHKLGKPIVAPERIINIPNNGEHVIWHFSSYLTSSLELAHNRYANLEAVQRYKILGQRFSGFNALMRLFVYFWGTYIGLGGFKGGWPGLFISVQIAYYKFSIIARVWELEKGLDQQAIEKKYIILKNKLIDGLHDER